MEPLEGKLGLLVEELANIHGVMRDEQFLSNSSILCSVTDVENTVKELFPIGPHHHADRHGMRRCLRHLNRCLTQLHEKITSNKKENKNQFSDKFKSNLVTIVTKLRLPFEDDYAMELAEAVLHLSADLLVESAVLHQSPEHLHTVLRRIILYGEEHQLRRQKVDISKHSICLPWLKIITQRWDDSEEASQSDRECASQQNSSNEHFPFRHFTGSPMQCTLDLQSAIKTASVVFTFEKPQTIMQNEVNLISETILLWHDLIVLMIRHFFQLIDLQVSHGDLILGECPSTIFSKMDEDEGLASGPKHKLQSLRVCDDIDIYMQDLVELTLDTIDSAMSSRDDDRLVPSSDKSGSSSGHNLLGSTNNPDVSTNGKTIYIAVRLSVIASDAIEVLQTSSHLKLECASKLPAKLWKGLATAFVTEVDVSYGAQLEVSFCASVLSVAEAALALDFESVPSSIILVTFLRSLKFPDLLLDSEGIWNAMKFHMAEKDNEDLKRGVQTAALRIQQSVFCLANNTSSNDVNTSDTTIEQYEMLTSISKRIIEILPANSFRIPKTDSSDCGNQSADPWDEYFWRHMLRLGANDPGK